MPGLQGQREGEHIMKSSPSNWGLVRSSANEWIRSLVHLFVFFCIMLNVFKLNEMKIIFLVILPPPPPLPAAAQIEQKITNKVERCDMNKMQRRRLFEILENGKWQMESGEQRMANGA